MTNLEHMSYLVDRDICNNSVPHAWTSVVMISGLASSYRIRLIGRPAGQASWKAVFPNEKGELSGGWRAAQKTAGRAGVLHKKAVRWASEKGGACCRKGQPSVPTFSAAQLTVQPPARLHVQPTGPSCSAAWRPTLLCSSPACGKVRFFIWQHGPPARPACQPSI